MYFIVFLRYNALVSAVVRLHISILAISTLFNLHVFTLDNIGDQDGSGRQAAYELDKLSCKQNSSPNSDKCIHPAGTVAEIIMKSPMPTDIYFNLDC